MYVLLSNGFLLFSRVSFCFFNSYHIPSYKIKTTMLDFFTKEFFKDQFQFCM